MARTETQGLERTMLGCKERDKQGNKELIGIKS